MQYFPFAGGDFIKKILFLSISFLVLIAVLVFVYFDDGKQLEDVKLGYQIDFESQSMEESEEPLDLKKDILVEVNYQYPKENDMVEKISRKLVMKNKKNNEVVYEKQWEEDAETTGYDFPLDTTKFTSGLYNVELYKNSKLVKEKTIEFR